jgi:uncharacterized protein (DUF1697 family)
VALFADAGCADVKSYIQSGNIVFRATDTLAARLPEHIAAAIAAQFGLKVPVVTRAAAELARVIDDNPYLAAGADPDKLHVMFLAERPHEKHIRGLDPNRSPPDQFTVRGREVYMFCPNGLGRSKLTSAYFDTQLATIGTVRNWRTVLKLAEMTR